MEYELEYGQMFELNPNIKKYQSDQNQNQYIKYHNKTYLHQYIIYLLMYLISNRS